MFDIEKTAYGMQLTITGTPDKEETEELVEEMQSRVNQTVGEFHVFVDLRELDIYTSDAAAEMGELIKYSKQHGMKRSVSLVGSATSQLQIDRLVDAAGADELVIHAAEHENPERLARQWLETGDDPT